MFKQKRINPIKVNRHLQDARKSLSWVLYLRVFVEEPVVVVVGVTMDGEADVGCGEIVDESWSEK